MACNWPNKDYFAELMCSDQRSHRALEMLVDDLHSEKERTISTFLCHSGSEDFLWSLVRLLGNDIPRVAGNAAYIIGTLAESELGCYRIISLAKSQHPDSRNLLCDLTKMLTSHDPESVMNAAGTLGTLAESADGREWMISETCMQSMLDYITNLLHVDNLWTASNAALVLARLSISEDGCTCILKHPHSQHILTCLIQALGVDEAGRGMNAAFAVGRLCDIDAGRQCLLNFPDSEKMISSLVKMLSCEDAGASKNACFALSCLAANHEGHRRLLNNPDSGDVLKTLSQLLRSEDSETGWFAAMTLRTLASQPKGCIRLREFPEVYSALKEVELLTDINADLKEEVMLTLEILRPLDPPDSPTVTVLGPTLCCASWNKIATKCIFDIWYQLFEGSKCVYNGPKCQCEVSSLLPHKTYSFKVRAVNEVEESAFSGSTTVITEEDLPKAPQNLRVLGTTATQLKVGWSPPEDFCGVSKGYFVYQGKALVEHTMELSSITSGLTANTTYEIQVCAATSKGKGARATCTGTTAELGAHAPRKPHVQVLGRNEVHVSWEPPEMPLGRITRYDVSMNGKIIYSGTELSCGAHRLTPDTEYSFIVTALTNEGKFDSKATKKRTARDEFDPDRPPLYQAPKKEEEPKKSSGQKKMRSASDVRSGGVQSGKESHTCSSDSTVSAISDVSPQYTHGPVVKPDVNGEDHSPVPSPAQKTKLVAKDVSTKKENMSLKTNKNRTPLSSKRRSSFSAPSQHEFPSSSPTLKVYTSRISEPPKSSLPVTISYVSIHGGYDQSLELNAVGPDYCSKKTLIPSPPLYSNTNPSLRVEQSKTTLMHSKLRSDRLCKPEKIDTDDPLYKDLFHPSSDTIHQSFHSTSGHTLSFPPSPKSVFLPKPTVPSSDYLDGSRSFSTTTEVPSVSHSLPSQRTFMGQEIENSGETKSSLSDFHYHHGRRKDGEHSSSVYMQPHLTAADPNFCDAQRAFIHRTNTFIGSHRPALRKAHATNAQVQLVGSASIALTSKSSRSHNKFVPVQLRAQPNNLTASQLRRANTTLCETGRGGLPNQRMDALARNNTQINLRLQPKTSETNRMMRFGTPKHGTDILKST